jgi:hypothetical protein
MFLKATSTTVRYANNSQPPQECACPYDMHYARDRTTNPHDNIIFMETSAYTIAGQAVTLIQLKKTG